MRIRFSGLIVTAILGLALSSAVAAQPNQGAAGATNKQVAAKPGPAPVRDLSGVWNGPVQAKMNTTPPLTALGQKLFGANQALGGISQSKIDEVAAGISNDPAEKCDPSGLPLAVDWNLRGMQFIQTPTKMVQMYQYQKTWREIWTDGRPLPKDAGGTDLNAPDPRYYGYSIGRWDGNYTFVVDTVGMDERTWIDHLGHPHSSELKMQEKYTRMDHDNMQNAISIDDPKIYAKPYVATTVPWQWDPKQEFEEQLCIPSDAEAYLDVIAKPAAAAPKK
jgi:hypothetical protein